MAPPLHNTGGLETGMHGAEFDEIRTVPDPCMSYKRTSKQRLFEFAGRNAFDMAAFPVLIRLTALDGRPLGTGVDYLTVVAPAVKGTERQANSSIRRADGHEHY
jgi:hypothetical protein